MRLSLESHGRATPFLWAIAFLTLHAVAWATPIDAVIRHQLPAHRLVLGFEEPLVATGPTSVAEDAELSRAIQGFQFASPPDSDIAVRGRPFVEFLVRYPASAWRMSLLTNLGIAYYQDGYFSKAFGAWGQAWRAGKGVESPSAKALTDRAVGELARMHARVGHANELEMLFDELGDHQVGGAASEMITGAREGL